MDQNQVDSSYETGRIFACSAGRSKIADAGFERKIEHAETVHINPLPPRPRHDWKGPRTLTLKRHHDGGYGFTLRYFVVYPPRCVYQKNSTSKESDFDSCWSEFDVQDEEEQNPEPLDTFFVKNIIEGGPAALAGLTEGDRIVSVNGHLIGGKKYKDVVDLIQSSIGDLKLGVVPRNEDILQLAYQEYVDDHASQGYSDGWKHLAADFDMQHPSVNKWSTPIVHSRKSSGSSTAEGGRAVKVKRYDPCVEFQAGTPVLSAETRLPGRESDAGIQSGNSSDDSTHFIQKENTEPFYKYDKRGYDSSVFYVDGNTTESSTIVQDSTLNNSTRSRSNSTNEDRSRSSSLNSDTAGTGEYIPSRVAGGKSFFSPESSTDGAAPSKAFRPKRSSDSGNKIEREVVHISNPGLVRRLAGTFNSGNVSRKNSATSVLRNDFQASGTSVLREDFTGPLNNGKEYSVVPSLTVSPGEESSRAEDFDRVVHTREDVRFHLSVNVSESNLNQNSTSSSGPRDHKRSRTKTSKLSSLTSQATLVESQYLATAQPSSGGDTSSEESSPTGPGGSTITTITQSGPASKSVRRTIKLRSEGLNKNVNNRVGYVVTGDHNHTTLSRAGTGTGVVATTKISSSSDISDDDSTADLKDDYRDTTVPELQRQTSEDSVDDLDEIKNEPIVREGPLHKKMVQTSDGRKRTTMRGWKPVYAVLRGHTLYCNKDRSVTTSSGYDDERIQSINIKGSVVDIAHDYGKRKHVFRLATLGGSEYLFQAEDTQSMMSWVNNLRDSNPDKEGSGGGYEDVIIRRMKTYENESTGPSLPGSKHQSKKTLSLRKTHFILGRSGTKKRNPVSVHISLAKEKELQPAGITFGIPLESCPQAKSLQCVPLIVEHCCQVVEEKGLECIGIYRVPGNAAAIQALQEELDTKDPDAVNWEEEKWYDLNNISSLLKSFLRKLPEPVIPKDMYEKFIQANRTEPAVERLRALKQQVNALPEYHYETLQFLIKHLKKVADFSETNKMEPKNLAIVFGPTVVRTSEENMVTMVKDMSDQCRIIETLLQQCDWIYAEDETMEAVTIEPVEGRSDSFGQNNGIVASKGLLESLGQVAESLQGDAGGDHMSISKLPAGSSKEGKGVASAIMSLTSFTTSFSMKLRNKAMSPMFSKKPKPESQAPVSEDECSESQDESSSPLTGLRRLGSDQHVLGGDATENGTRQRSVKSDGEDDEEPFKVKSPKTKHRGYVRALGPAPAPHGRKIPPKVPEEAKSKAADSGSSSTKNSSSVLVQLKKDASPKDDSKKEFNFDAYKAGMLSEKTRMRLIKVSMEHHAAMEQRQIEKDRIDRERERTLQDLRQDEDDFLDDQLAVSPGRESDDNLSSTSDSTNSSRKESVDSLSSPPFQRKVITHARQISGSSISSEEKAPSYAINFRDMRRDFRKPQPVRIQPLQPPQAVQVQPMTPMVPTEPVQLKPMQSAVRREIGEEEKRELEVFMGQFESCPEDEPALVTEEDSSETKYVPKSADKSLFEAKTLDEKLKILLDPMYQEKDGCLVKNTESKGEGSGLSPRSRSDPDSIRQQRTGEQGPWVLSPTQERRSNFSASIRGIERPYKTKVIGLNVTRSSPVSPTGPPLYGSEMAARIDTFKQKKQELERKVTSILQESSKSKESSPRDLSPAFAYFDDFRSLDTSRSRECRDDEPSSSFVDNHDLLRRSDELRISAPRDKETLGAGLSPETQRVIVSAGNVQQTRSTPLQVRDRNTESPANSQDRLDRNVQQVVELLSASDHGTGSTPDTSDSSLAALLSRLQRQKVEIVEPHPPVVATALPVHQPLIKPISPALARYEIHPGDGNLSRLPAAPVQGDRTRQLSSKDNTRTRPGGPDLVRVQEWRTGNTPTGLNSPRMSKPSR